jgi:hypothetical protein
MVTVTGNVKDSDSGAPIENATVVLGKEFAMTGEMGGYTITDLTPGDYTLIVVQRFYEKYETPVTIVGDSEVDIKLQRE